MDAEGNPKMTEEVEQDVGGPLCFQVRLFNCPLFNSNGLNVGRLYCQGSPTARNGEWRSLDHA